MKAKTLDERLETEGVRVYGETVYLGSFLADGWTAFAKRFGPMRELTTRGWPTEQRAKEMLLGALKGMPAWKRKDTGNHDVRKRAGRRRQDQRLGQVRSPDVGGVRSGG